LGYEDLRKREGNSVSGNAIWHWSGMVFTDNLLKSNISEKRLLSTKEGEKEPNHDTKIIHDTAHDTSEVNSSGANVPKGLSVSSVSGNNKEIVFGENMTNIIPKIVFSKHDIHDTDNTKPKLVVKSRFEIIFLMIEKNKEILPFDKISDLEKEFVANNYPLEVIQPTLDLLCNQGAIIRGPDGYKKI